MSASWSIGWSRLYDIKTGAAEEPPHPFWMEQYIQRGIDTEAEARMEYTLQTSIDLEPIIAENEEFPYLAASIDGFNRHSRHIAEFKFPSKSDHGTALKGEIPKKYIPQLCHQMYVTGAKTLDYCSFDGEKLKIIPFHPDKKLVLEIMDVAHSFWNDFVIPRRRPTQDYPHPDFDRRMLEVSDEDLVKEAIRNLSLRDDIRALQHQLDESDQRILSGCQLDRAKIGDLMIVKRGNSRMLRRA